MSFSSRLKSLRSSHSISQATLAKILGVTQQAVGKWEVDKATPDYDTLRNVAKYFQVSVDFLLELTDTPDASPAPPAASAPPITPQDRELLRKYHELDQRGRQAVLDTIEREHSYTAPKVEDAGT